MNVIEDAIDEPWERLSVPIGGQPLPHVYPLPRPIIR